MTRLTWLLAVTGLASARGYDPEACLNSFTEVASNAIARRTVIQKYYVTSFSRQYDVITEIREMFISNLNEVPSFLFDGFLIHDGI